MFYGSGAGKLPTASAVVADIVDMAKHQHVNIVIDWKEEKMELLDYKDCTNVFFVRTAASKAEAEKVFGKVTYVEAGISGEIGFTTEAMTEGEFETKAEELGILNRIRLA